jgi:hypothetical protein
MKILSLLVLVPTLAFADSAPPEWKLPNKGKDCKFQKSFHASPVTCGIPVVQVWSCPDSDYALVGKYGSDVGNGCSPTEVFESAIPQAKPER